MNDIARLLLIFVMLGLSSGVFWIPFVLAGTALGVGGFRGRRLETTIIISWGVLQLAVLLVWSAGITAVAAFQDFNPGSQQRILPPELEGAIMVTFWILMLLLILIMGACWVRREAMQVGPVSRAGRTARILCVILLLFTTCAMFINMQNYRRMGASLARTVSPDGQTEVNLMPMNCWIDVNGLLIYRHKGDFWWRSAASMGDNLTGARSITFRWLSDKRVVLTVNREDCVDYDFATNRELDIVPASTSPTTVSGESQLREQGKL